MLQEANRRFFHILGVELVAKIDEDNRYSLHFVDGRTQEGGMTFAHSEPRWSAVRQERARRLERMLAVRLRVRRRVHKFGRQPIDQL
jgi:hypothetical protein